MKYRKCPAAPNCWDYKSGCCEDCAHSAKYQKLFRKIERQEKEITRLKSERSKDEPMQPDYEADGYADGVLCYDTAYCPKCHHEFEYGINDWGCKYCQDCGQALDWSGNE